MGIMDNMLQSESLSNCNHSNGKCGGRLLLENGHTAAMAASLPKYKQRRVSAVRDFPVGCGRFAQMLSTAIGAGFSGTDVNVVVPVESAPRSSCITVGGEADQKDEHPLVLSDQGNGSMPTSEAPPKSLRNLEMVGSVKALDCKTTKLFNDQPMMRQHPGRQRVSAVRDFPPFCGRNAPRLDKDRFKEIVSSAEDNSLVQEKPDIAKREDKEPIKTDIVQMRDVQDGDAQPTSLQRCFSTLVADEIKAEASALVSLEKSKTGELPASSANKMKGPQEVIKLLEDSQQHYGLQNGPGLKSCVQDIVALNKDESSGIAAFMEESLDRNLPNLCKYKSFIEEEDSEGVVFKLKGAVILGLMAADSCPWRKGKADYKLESLVDGAAQTKWKKNKLSKPDNFSCDVAKTNVKSNNSRCMDGSESNTLVALEKSSQDGSSTPYNEMKGSQEVSNLLENIQQQYGLQADPDSKPCIRDIVALEEEQKVEIAACTEECTDRNLSNLSEYKALIPEKETEGVLFMKQTVVLGLMAVESYPCRKGKADNKLKCLAGGSSQTEEKKHEASNKPDKPISDTAKSEARRNNSRCTDELKPNSGKQKDIINFVGISEERTSSEKGKSCQGFGQMVALNDEDYQKHEEGDDYFLLVRRSSDMSVSLPPSHPSNFSGKGDHDDSIVSRSKVRETLRLFHAICRKLLQAKESKQGNGPKRVDLHAAKMLKDKSKYANVEKVIGSVPGVEVGDEFNYRVELNIVGLHRPIQGGIGCIKQGGKSLAASIVASGGYDDDMDYSDVLIYTGSGGNIMGGDKQREDQKLELGNLALKNSVDEKNPVRVIRGDTKLSDDGKARTYIYDGLYLVEKWWKEIGQHGKLVYKYRLVRMQGQPELAWKVLKKSKKLEVREGLCVDDISHGKEMTPICAVNTFDDERPPAFEYITCMIYPDWFHAIPPKGCGCTRGCSESGSCTCVAKNGGEIPYNHNGAIVEAKSLVIECGLLCRCPPSCHNRVSQHGIKFQLEIFKTESRGWGVRSLNSIPSGSFICEYLGELLEEKEAELRAGNDEYLFDIGNKYNDDSLWDELSTILPDTHSSPPQVVEVGSFTIDAARYGNIGRFINHSCSPNLYAQNVLHDHEDKRIPHIMLFAAENIPPLQELTYHYNYEIDHVLDSDGNIRKKNCYCGSSECTGRLY